MFVVFLHSDTRGLGCQVTGCQLCSGVGSFHRSLLSWQSSRAQDDHCKKTYDTKKHRAMLGVNNTDSADVSVSLLTKNISSYKFLVNT